jgi:hypothetical protein
VLIREEIGDDTVDSGGCEGEFDAPETIDTEIEPTLKIWPVDILALEMLPTVDDKVPWGLEAEEDNMLETGGPSLEDDRPIDCEDAPFEDNRPEEEDTPIEDEIISEGEDTAGEDEAIEEGEETPGEDEKTREVVTAPDEEDAPGDEAPITDDVEVDVIITTEDEGGERAEDVVVIGATDPEPEK